MLTDTPEKNEIEAEASKKAKTSETLSQADPPGRRRCPVEKQKKRREF